MLIALHQVPITEIISTCMLKFYFAGEGCGQQADPQHMEGAYGVLHDMDDYADNGDNEDQHGVEEQNLPPGNIAGMY